MKKIIKISAICALGMSIPLFAEGLNFAQNGVHNNYLQTSVGVENFKTLGKNENFVNLKYFNTKINSVIDVTVSDPYKNFSIETILPSVSNFQNGNTYIFSYTLGIGFLQHDSRSKVNEQKTIQSQKAPYLTPGVQGSIVLHNGVILTAAAKFKIPLDRSDMTGAYSVSTGIHYQRWNLTAQYDQFHFSGVKNQEDVSVRFGYSFAF
ncbi:hypothetical protein [Sulfurospirillum sp. 1612]|uniref:hypothetical protein n=1 Tax=Sulfurospirillum sp. 1612 TaxID=3094835 RepID=UPI002F92A54C